MPVYPLTEGITGNVLRKIIRNGLDTAKDGIIESLPSGVIKSNNLCDRSFAIEKIHFPDTSDDFEKARYRIAFEELFTTELGLLMMKEKVKVKDLRN